MLAYERMGSGEPLVLVHGIGHRRQAWYPVVDRLAQERDVILVDLPGHGESPALKADGIPIKDALEAHLNTFLDELELDRPHVAGNSLGGRIAMEMAASDKVRSVTALAPAAFWKNAKDFAYIHHLFRTMSTAGAALQSAAPMLARTSAGKAVMYGWLTKDPSRIDPAVAVEDLRCLLAARPALRTILRGAYPFDRAIPAHIPVTIAWGTHDHVLRSYQAERARNAMPEATHITLPGCGHVPMTDNPELIADVILAGSAKGKTTPKSGEIAA